MLTWIQLRYRRFPSAQRSPLLLFDNHTYFPPAPHMPTSSTLGNHQSVLRFYHFIILRMLYKWKVLLWISRWRTWHSVHEDMGSIPSFTQWVRYLAFPQARWWTRLGCSIAVAVAPIQPLAPELPYAAGAALKRKREREKECYGSSRCGTTKKIIIIKGEFLLWLSG